MIGDNVYVDYYIEHVRLAEEPPPENLLALYREAYRHAWGHENFRGFPGQISTYMIFDDHEFWFPFVGEINAGVVHVRRSGERPQVWFELYDKQGALLRREKPHAV